MVDAFAVWLTGLPASGKSTIARELARSLSARSLALEVLESDVARTSLTPEARYDERERELFYRALAFTASRLVAHGVAVIIDATANRRAYRDQGRAWIPRFLEVWIDTPLEVCAARDPKGLYRRSTVGEIGSLPGVGASYESPLKPDLVIDGEHTAAAIAAEQITSTLEARGWL